MRENPYCFPRNLLEAAQGLVETFTGMALPVMPAVPNQIFRLRHVKAIAEFWMIADPCPVFFQGSLNLSNGHRYGMPRDGDAMPGIADHRLIVDTTTAALNQCPQRV